MVGLCGLEPGSLFLIHHKGHLGLGLAHCGGVAGKRGLTNRIGPLFYVMDQSNTLKWYPEMSTSQTEPFLKCTIHGLSPCLMKVSTFPALAIIV